MNLLKSNIRIKEEKNPILKSNLIGNKTTKYECPNLIEIAIFEIQQRITTTKQLENIKSQIPQDLFEKFNFSNTKELDSSHI